MFGLPKLGELDETAKSLLSANIVSILLALIFGFELSALVWVYWAESVIIGFWTVAALIYAGLRISRKQAGFAFTMLFFVGFFLIHYGMFHLGYLVFLATLPWFTPTMGMLPYLGLTSAIFFLSHGFSFYVNSVKRTEIVEGGQDMIGRIFFAPYKRIVPMHLTIIFSAFIAALLPVYAANIGILMLFMGLKTMGDLYAHQKKHHAI